MYTVYGYTSSEVFYQSYAGFVQALRVYLAHREKMDCYLMRDKPETCLYL